ncbi:16S rRNA (guanine(966)-N(2))-methyltransferase RsmD [Parvularcula maris]|uniref:16S rRNA (Guanine(966)-N(2))-methyltransferase RsmD n=1 Tax=Parvularcula maris TaxID=2965077 RepID=A0A9X2RIG0_9PROT|nr:16S rRNA (guanine(966)-N(2))-methyltransferase RsmD [Parvularcula maris]MCQ8185954.1 16S rRNA (guanine(966)-N(2))-methyltransferase RsmD [Parvularcula maris]
MRIVGGRFKGRKITAPSGLNTRPTTDRTREALFNILAHREGVELEGARVLDLFAGSGALGFEALSRGGAFCLFVDNDAGARGAIRDNIEALQLFGETRLHRRPADALGKKPANVGDPFDLVFMDPPYGKGLIAKAVSTVIDGEWLSPGALIVAEHSKGEALDLPEGAEPEETRGFGDTEITFLRIKTA